MRKTDGDFDGMRRVLHESAWQDQNSIENLSILLAAAGRNYFMGLPMGDDPMLSYQSNSFHDAAVAAANFAIAPTAGI